MPVVVTGAGGLLGRALVSRMAGAGLEVRAHVRRGAVAESLRSIGAKVAVGELTDREQLAAVVRDAHTVCHLVGGLDLEGPTDYVETNLETTRWVLEAAGDAGVQRFLFLSFTGADPGSSNAYLRTKGQAEDAIRDSRIAHFILRPTHVYGKSGTWLHEMALAARRPVATLVGPGDQRLAPVYVGDVAAIFAAADDRRAPISGTYAVQGPDVVTLDGLIDLLAGGPKRKLHMTPDSARKAARLTGKRYSPDLLEVLARDCLADAGDAAAALGVPLTPLAEGLRLSGLGPE